MADQTGYLTIKGLPGPDVLWALNGGVFADLSLNDFLFLRPEINFSMRGEQTEIKGESFPGPPPEGPYNVSSSANFNYLEIPILLRAQLELAPDLNGSFLIGPSFAFLLNASANIVYSNGTNLPPSEHYSITQTNTFNLSGILGVELESNHWLLDLRYSRGLTNVFQDDVIMIADNDLSLDIGYRIQ